MPQVASPSVQKEADGDFQSTDGQALGTPKSVGDADETPNRPLEQVNTNRCFACNKRVGFTGFRCRCEYTFCASHRHSNKHNCTFDYKALGRDAVAKANPAVIADKVDKVCKSRVCLLSCFHHPLPIFSLLNFKFHLFLRYELL